MKQQTSNLHSIDPILVNEREAAKLLSFSQRTLQNYRLNGGGPAYVQLTGRRIAYQPQALREWAEKRLKQSTSHSGIGNSGK